MSASNPRRNSLACDIIFEGLCRVEGANLPSLAVFSKLLPAASVTAGCPLCPAFGVRNVLRAASSPCCSTNSCFFPSSPALVLEWGFWLIVACCSFSTHLPLVPWLQGHEGLSSLGDFCSWDSSLLLQENVIY